MLAKMASGSGKRWRLHRGFSKGQVAFHHSAQPSPLVTRVGSLPPATRPSNRLASVRAVSGVQGESHTCAAFAADRSADIDGRHAAGDSRKVAGESGFCGLSCAGLSAPSQGRTRLVRL
jgi:hypothetical protein